LGSGTGAACQHRLTSRSDWHCQDNGISPEARPRAGWGDGWNLLSPISQFASDRLEAFVRPLLIRSHQPRITGHISGDDRGKAAGRHGAGIARASRRRRSADRRAWRADRQDHRRRRTDGIRLRGRCRAMRHCAAKADDGTQCRDCGRSSNGLAHWRASRRRAGRGRRHHRRRRQYRGPARGDRRARRHLRLGRCLPPGARQSGCRV